MFFWKCTERRDSVSSVSTLTRVQRTRSLNKRPLLHRVVQINKNAPIQCFVLSIIVYATIASVSAAGLQSSQVHTNTQPKSELQHITSVNSSLESQSLETAIRSARAAERSEAQLLMKSQQGMEHS